MHDGLGIFQRKIRFITVTLQGFASDRCCFSDGGGAADKIRLIPQDFFAELVSRAVNGVGKGFWHSRKPFYLSSFGFCVLQRGP